MGNKIRILGISTSPRKGANTETMVKEALTISEEFGSEVGFKVKTKMISLAGKKILPCYNCNQCVKQGSYCVLKDDWLELIEQLINPPPNGVIFGSPVYFFHQNSQARAFMERCTSLLKKLWHPEFPHEPPDFSKTVAGAISVGSDRHGGVEHVLSSIIHWFLTMGFVAVGGFYIGGAGWTHESTQRNGIENDQIGLDSAHLVGKKVAKTAILLKRGSEEIGDRLPFVLWKS